MNDHCNEVVDELARISDVPRYLELRRRMRTTDVSSDVEFQDMYRDYWRMSLSRLGGLFYRRYFQSMEAIKNSAIGPDEAEIRRVAMLSDTPERSSLQFSHATKLLNTVDPRQPVYDTHVASFYFFVPPASDRPFEARLDTLLAFYDFLRREYARVLGHGLLQPAIGVFRDRITSDPDLYDERVVDLLIWGFVSLMRSDVQRRGQVLYR